MAALVTAIPEGIANVAEDWKVVDGDRRILRSRWEWTPIVG